MNRKLLLNSLFVLSAVGLGVGLSIKPWKVYRLQRQAADTAVADMRTAEKDRAELTRKKAQYDSELGKEDLARDEGYRQANEVPVEDKIDAND
ncbi:MAG TPA: hypothetical protein VGL56_01120 [Fimbriimonadaceae bacterium]|jgi:hypothetical protein